LSALSNVAHYSTKFLPQGARQNITPLYLSRIEGLGAHNTWV
jgi:hypothetical protein